MSKLTQQSCKVFLEELASERPTPGGGGAAAMAGAMAGALSSMVANLTIGKEKFAAVKSEVKNLCEEADCLRSSLLNLVEQDAAVFASFMACYKLPKSTEEEKKFRLDSIHTAAMQAATIPMEIARASAKVLDIADRIAVIGNPNVITDATCSALIARAAMRCAFYNVYINLKLTKNEAFNQALIKEIEELENKALVAENRVLEVTDKALA